MQPIEWRPVNGYEDLYEVSDRGNVRPYGKPDLRKRPSRKGYWTVTLYRSGRRKTVMVHRIVIVAWYGRPADGLEARHLDGVNTNNLPSNLAWGTKAENEHDKLLHGTARPKLSHKTCRRGHAYSPENTHTQHRDERTYRTCRACNRENVAAYRARQSTIT
jgi:hypothetical protein